MVVVAKVPTSTNAVSDRRMCFLPFMFRDPQAWLRYHGPYQPPDERPMNPLPLRFAVQQDRTRRCLECSKGEHIHPHSGLQMGTSAPHLSHPSAYGRTTEIPCPDTAVSAHQWYDLALVGVRLACTRFRGHRV